MPKLFTGLLDEGTSSEEEITVPAVNEFEASRMIADQFFEEHHVRHKTLRFTRVKDTGADPFGYRVGEPQKTRAVDVLRFEVEDSGNAHMVTDAARALKLDFTTATLDTVLAEIEKRFGPDAVAIWTTQDPEWASKQYGPGTVFRVEIPSDALVLSDLGSDGQLWLWRNDEPFKFEESSTLKTEITSRDDFRFLTNIVRCLSALSDELFIIIKPYREGLMLYSVEQSVAAGFCYVSSGYFTMYDFNGNEPRYIRVNAEPLGRILARLETEPSETFRVYFETDWNELFFSTRDRQTRMFELKISDVEPDDSIYPTLKDVAGSPVPHADVVYASFLEADLADAVRDLNNAKRSDGGLKYDGEYGVLKGSWAKHEWISTALNVRGYVDTGEGTQAGAVEGGRTSFRVMLDKKPLQVLNSCLSSLRRVLGKEMIVSLGKREEMLLLTVERPLNLVLGFNAEAWPDVFEWEKPTTPDVQFALKFSSAWDKLHEALSSAYSNDRITQEEHMEILTRVEDQTKTLLDQVKAGTVTVDDAYARIKQVTDEETAKLKPPVAAAVAKPVYKLEAHWGTSPRGLTALYTDLTENGTSLLRGHREMKAGTIDELRGTITEILRGLIDEAGLEASTLAEERNLLVHDLIEGVPSNLVLSAPAEFVKVLILKSVPQFVGVDMKIYGPYEPGTVYEMPKPNADDLVSMEAASYELVPAPAAPAPPAVVSREEVYRMIDDGLNEWIPFYIEQHRSGLEGNLHYDAPQFETETLARFTADEVKRKYADDIFRRKEDEYRHYQEVSEQAKKLVLDHLPENIGRFASDLVVRLYNQLLGDARALAATVKPAPPAEDLSKALSDASAELEGL